MSEILNPQPPEARRPVPHVNHSKELEDAACAVLAAKVDGKAVRLVPNPLDVNQVRDKLRGIGALFEDPSFFFENVPNGELVAVENLILLATLLREHLRAGNTT